MLFRSNAPVDIEVFVLADCGYKIAVIIADKVVGVKVLADNNLAVAVTLGTLGIDLPRQIAGALNSLLKGHNERRVGLIRVFREERRLANDKRDRILLYA